MGEHIVRANPLESTQRGIEGQGWTLHSYQLAVQITPSLAEKCTPAMLEALQYFNQIQVDEIDSGEEGPTIMMIDGLHGEEFDRPTIAQCFNLYLTQIGGRLTRGKIKQINELNVPGTQNGTRHLHESERDTRKATFSNLNDVFHLYTGGDEAELEHLISTHQSPTALYGWLFSEWVTKEVVAESGGRDNLLIYDFHSDDRITPPYQPIDRVFNEHRPPLSELQALFNMAQDAHVAVVFDFPHLAQENSSTLSAGFNRLGVRTLTLERGPTHLPNKQAVPYVAFHILSSLVHEGMVEVDSDRWKELVCQIEETVESNKLLRLGREMWEDTYLDGVVYALDERPPAIIRSTGEKISTESFLRELCNNPSFDGVFYLHYFPDLVGVRGKNKEVPIATLTLQAVQGDGEMPYLLSLNSLSRGEMIVSIPEDVHNNYNGAIKCALQLTKRNGKIELWIADGTPDDQDILSPEEMCALLEQGVEVDLSYAVTLAVPDPDYETVRDDGKVSLREIAKEQKEEITTDYQAAQ